MSTILETKNLTMRFGGLVAVSDFTASIPQGSITGLIGPNGAGKTTCFNMVTGFYRPTEGQVFFEGKELTGMSPHQVCRAGIARTFQNIRLFRELTALENVMAGHHIRTKAGIWGILGQSRHTREEERRTTARAHELLDYVGIGRFAGVVSKNLPYGDQRRLEIARALATEPQLLALDEPAAGMNATETGQLRQLIEQIRADGVTVMLIEHDVMLVMGLCDRVAVLDFGRKIAEDVPAVVQKDEAVIAAYLGAGRHGH